MKRIEKSKDVQSITPMQDKFTFFISKEQQEQKYDNKIKPIKDKIKYYKEVMKENLERAKQYDIDVETSGTATANHYRIARSELKKYEERLKEFGDKTFEDKTITLKDYDTCKELLEMANIDLHNNMSMMNEKLLIENTAQLYRLNEKYPIVAKEISKEKLNTITFRSNNRTYAQTSQGLSLEYNLKYFDDYEKLKEHHLSDGRTNWHFAVDEEFATIYTTTHEYGHIVEFRYRNAYNTNKSRFLDRRGFDSMVMDRLYSIAEKSTKLKRTELKKQYLTDYGMSKRNFEAWAEIFAGMELGVDNPLTQAMKEIIEVMNGWI